MNVCISIPCLKIGGTEMQTLNLVKTLVGAGHKVTTLCYFEVNLSIVDEFIDCGCKIELMQLQRSIRPWQLVRLLRNRFKELQPDVVHVQYMAPGALPILAARLAGIKRIVATVHQPYTTSHGRLAKILLRFSAFFCTRFIVVSKNAEISWFGSGHLFDENRPIQSQPRHFTIYNAVDVIQLQEIQRKAAPHQSDLSIGKLVIGVVSRLRHEKGIDLLINAFIMAIQQFPNIHLLIIGSGPEEEKFKKQLCDFSLESATTFYGESNWVNAIQQMSLMDIVVVPSRFEGFGLTAAEAMAMGKPVVATNVFGLCEVVTDQETGLLFPKESIEALSNCLLQLCNNPDLRLRLGINGRIKAEKLFDIAVFKRKTINLYEQLVMQIKDTDIG